jgi:hypothetical protein
MHPFLLDFLHLIGGFGGRRRKNLREKHPIWKPNLICCPGQPTYSEFVDWIGSLSLFWAAMETTSFQNCQVDDVERTYRKKAAP